MINKPLILMLRNNYKAAKSKHKNKNILAIHKLMSVRLN